MIIGIWHWHAQLDLRKFFISVAIYTFREKKIIILNLKLKFSTLKAKKRKQKKTYVNGWFSSWRWQCISSCIPAEWFQQFWILESDDLIFKQMIWYPENEYKWKVKKVTSVKCSVNCRWLIDSTNLKILGKCVLEINFLHSNLFFVYCMCS